MTEKRKIKRLPSIHSLLAIVAIATLFSTTAHAKVDSVKTWVLNSATGKYLKERFWISVGKLTMRGEVVGNPTIRFRLYHAPGADPSLDAFTMIDDTYTQPFFGNGYRLDEEDLTYALKRAVKDLPGGVHSFYVTADDGEGESAPSNILVADFYSDYSEVYPTPEILAAEALDNGNVHITLAPVTMAPGIDPQYKTIFFFIYRADGEQTAYDHPGFTLLRHSQGGVFNEFYEWEGVSLGRGKMELTLSGLKRGKTSLYIVLGQGIDPPFTRPSRIVVLDVQGANSFGGPYALDVDVPLTSGIAEAAALKEVVPYPNPASHLLRLPAPNGGETAMIRIYDLRGTEVRAVETQTLDGACTIDISTLPGGSYTAVISGRGGLTRSRFQVTR